MIHEHEALEIASAGIDFGLTPEVERELALTYRECPVCAERAASYREQIRLMQRLPVLDASGATRQRVTEAALSGRGNTRSPLVLALAAALLVGLLLAMAAAAGALLERRHVDDLLANQPTPSAGAPSVTSPNPGQSQLPPPAGGGVFGDQLPPDSLAEVVETNVRVRSQPRVADDSALLEPFLQPGDRLFVVEGPVVASDYDWYRVVPIGTTRGRPTSELPTGWVSRGDHDANPWIRPVAPDCPRLPVDIAVLNAKHPLERLACFGATPLSYWAVIEGGSQSGWIAETQSGANLEPTEGLAVTLQPSQTTRPDLPDLRAAFLEGAFDHPDCGSGAGREPMEALDCRTTFVVTGATIDDADLQPGALAITTTDNLRVRTQPLVDDASGKLELLRAGTRVGIVGGPAVGSGYVWYRIAVPSIRTPDGRARVGWVAAHSTDGERWVGTEAFDCAAADAVSLEQLAALTTPPLFHGGLSCYGRGTTKPAAELIVDARFRRDCSEPAGAGSFWLTDPGRGIVLSNGVVELRAVLDGDIKRLGPCPSDPSAASYRVIGHFDDDAASQCRSPGADARVPDPAATYECRMRFVVTSLAVAGASASRAPGAP
jgi:hypothetical protein